MADEKEDKNSKISGKDVYIPQTAQDVQRMKIEKLTNNPVGISFILQIIYFCKDLVEILGSLKFFIQYDICLTSIICVYSGQTSVNSW